MARAIGLSRTLDFAKANASFYQNLPSLEKLEQFRYCLSQIPITTKEDLRAAGDRIRCEKGLPAYIGFTGGTTGPSVLVYGAYEDIDHIYWRKAVQSDTQDRLRSLCLISGAGSSQGLCPTVPGRTGSISVPLRSRRGFEWAWDMLTREHNYAGYEKKISRVVLPLPALKKLVHCILDWKLNTDALGLKEICTFSAYLSHKWRNRITSVLSASVVDCYGLSEIPAARAFSCKACGYYHFSEAVIPEVVDLWTGEPLLNGLGKLLLTALYPYTRAFALFRFDTGDLVEVGPLCHAAGEHGIRPKGRTAHSIICLKRKRVLLSASDIQEFLDSNEWVARISNTRHSGVTSTEDDSFPKWRITNSDQYTPEFHIEVELLSNPHLFAEQWKAFEWAFQSHLRTSGIDSNDVAANVHLRPLAPGSLNDAQVFKV